MPTCIGQMIFENEIYEQNEPQLSLLHALTTKKTDIVDKFYFRRPIRILYFCCVVHRKAMRWRTNTSCMAHLCNVCEEWDISAIPAKVKLLFILFFSLINGIKIWITFWLRPPLLVTNRNIRIGIDNLKINFNFSKSFLLGISFFFIKILELEKKICSTLYGKP